MPGYAKIDACCAQARSDGWEYAWIDSCCIDKSSSAELSEAINSMFKWYENAEIGYAYLSDVDAEDEIPKQLENSAWFTRGWTLQELLAPGTLVFFDRYWVEIGTKSSLEDHVSKITGIRELWNFRSCCIAEKMSWAAGRTTTRVEDEAYCLMGLFDVNMPLLYGEGREAFQRLQQEILKSSDDESLFAWYWGRDGDSILASSPKSFRKSSAIRKLHQPDRENGQELERNSIRSTISPPIFISVPTPSPSWPTSRTRRYFKSEEYPPTLSNKGLHLSLFLIPVDVFGDDLPGTFDHHAFTYDIRLWGHKATRLRTYVALLQNLSVGNETASPAIFLQRSESDIVVGEQKSSRVQDWRCERILTKAVLSIDLDRAQLMCAAWVRSKSQSNSFGEFLLPKSRLVYLRSQCRYHAKSDMSGLGIDIRTFLVNVTSLRESNFQIFSPLPLTPHERDEDINMTSWRLTNDGELYLRANPLNEVGPRGDIEFRHLYFCNYETKETILLLVSVRHTPRLVLLTLDITRNFRNRTLPSLVEDWWLIEGEQELGSDRVSYGLKSGKAVSASVRRVGGRDDHDYVIDLKIDTLGYTRWPLSKALQRFTDHIAEKLVSRDTDVKKLLESAERGRPLDHMSRRSARDINPAVMMDNRWWEMLEGQEEKDI